MKLMTGEQALSYIHGFNRFGSDLSLDRIKSLLNMMGNPQDKIKFIHIAGTNGKGSTAAFLSNIFMAEGLKTGLYTSPALERFTQRIIVDKQEINLNELAEITEKVKAHIEVMIADGNASQHPTEFEVVTAIAFQYFAECMCDIVVLETGLGGRFDATNIIEKPMVAVITNIGYDHTDRLGSTLPEIAFEKAGIIKEGCDVVLYPQNIEVLMVFKKTCREKGARLHIVDFSDLKVFKNDISGVEFCYKGDIYKTSLPGSHQANNAVVAIHVAQILSDHSIIKISKRNIKKGIFETKWPGRLEVINDRPLFLIDGAHNPQCAKALAEALNILFPDKKIIFILGVLKDKDYKDIIKTMLPLTEIFYVITPDNPRALQAQELAAIIKEMGGNAIIGGTIKEATETAVKAAGTDGIICAFGSLYYIGEVRKLLLEGGGVYD